MAGSTCIVLSEKTVPHTRRRITPREGLQGYQHNEYQHILEESKLTTSAWPVYCVHGSVTCIAVH